MPAKKPLGLVEKYNRQCDEMERQLGHPLTEEDENRALVLVYQQVHRDEREPSKEEVLEFWEELSEEVSERMTKELKEGHHYVSEAARKLLKH